MSSPELAESILLTRLLATHYGSLAGEQDRERGNHG